MHRSTQIVLVASALITILGLISSAVISIWFPEKTPQGLSSIEKEELGRFVVASQKLEFDFYRAPDKFNPEGLRRYWMSPEQGGTAADSIRRAIDNLKAKNLKYGPQSRILRLQVKDVSMTDDATVVVTTSEHWKLVKVDNKGTVVGQPIELDYPVQYTLKKKEGEWLIAATTTAYKD